MVAIISSGKSIRNIFYYNENKVKDGVANIIGAKNYPQQVADLSEKARLNMLLKMIEQNSRTKVNSLHITLNFGPSEILSTEKLNEIATLYMDKIGFGNQPYLIYQHFDAGHPHVHCITTNIEASGKAISLHNLGLLKSEPARKEIEIKYNLMKAEEQPKAESLLKPAYSAKIVYGKSDSKRAIQNVLTHLLDSYHYGSLTELNALLGQYNVKAERGTEDSRVYKNNGLFYRMLDDAGMPIGVPIKASLFYNKPTLAVLETRFINAGKEKVKYKKQLQTTIDLALSKHSGKSLTDLIIHLKTLGIHTLLRENKTGIIYGITYVDHRNKCVFNGSDLGKAYSANAITALFSSIPKPIEIITPQLEIGKGKQNDTNENMANIDANRKDEPDHKSSILDALLAVEHNADHVPYALGAKRKKRKKRKQS